MKFARGMVLIRLSHKLCYIAAITLGMLNHGDKKSILNLYDVLNV